ncbi:hypothetical protein BMS3Abin04_01872 [bacterium BMS3Abin04]|nr:hypothetical protein BMS3Abin04_01872 [bacterium BMS3Abin04]
MQKEKRIKNQNKKVKKSSREKNVEIYVSKMLDKLSWEMGEKKYKYREDLYVR